MIKQVNQLIDKFITWLTEIYNKYGFIGDNIAFDYGILTYFSKVDIRYLDFSSKKYIEIIAVDCFYHGMLQHPLFTDYLHNTSSKNSALKALGVDNNNPEWKSPIEHDHNSVHDAANIAWFWSKINVFLKM